ncbi:hypothetical protein SLA2020_358840 [Shorea laevis]
MRSKGQNQSKFMRFITIPFRVLGKARDLYVRSLTDCSHRVSHSDSVVLVRGQSSIFPRSFSASSSRSDDNEDYRDLIQAASVRSMGHRNEIDMLMKQQLMAMAETGRLPKSCSVGMGRIDEDEPCEFGEEVSSEPKMKSDLVYPRSKSCAVGKKTVLL